MTSRSVRLLAATSLTLAVLASCSSKSDQSETAAKTDTDVADAPDIVPTAAPGVAFNYAYGFNLADDRISSVQEAHAAACEQLGIARCRITGLEYSVNPDETVSANLAVKLEPSIARAFGKRALAIVERSDGKLRDLDIGGEDQQPGIVASQTQEASLAEKRDGLARQLASGGLKPSRRVELQEQINDLDSQIASARSTVQASAEKLANTPMTFNYYGRGGAPGFRDNPLRESWNLLVTTLIILIELILKALAVVVPVAVLVVILLALWRSRPLRAARRWFRRDDVQLAE